MCGYKEATAGDNPVLALWAPWPGSGIVEDHGVFDSLTTWPVWGRGRSGGRMARNVAGTAGDLGAQALPCYSYQKNCTRKYLLPGIPPSRQ